MSLVGSDASLCLSPLGTTVFDSMIGLAGVLGELVDEGEMGEADADRVAQLVCSDNARRAYALETQP